MLGIFTATESAAVAVAYALLVTILIYKSVNRTQMKKIMSDTMKTLSMVIAIIMTSSAFGYLLSFLSVPSLLADFILGLSDNPYVVLLAINILLLVLGMLMDMGVLILILTPILLPIAKTIGVDPIHFGIIMLLNLGIGVCTPPVGTSLMVGCGIGKVKIETTARHMLPFYLAMVVVLMLVTYMPAITLWLPSLL